MQICGLKLKQAFKELIDIMQSELLVDIDVLVLVNGYSMLLYHLVKVLNHCSSVNHEFKSEPLRVILIKPQVLIESEDYP